MFCSCCYCCCLFLVCSAAAGAATAAVAAPTKNDVRGVPDNNDGGLQPFKCAVNRNEYESVPAWVPGQARPGQGGQPMLGQSMRLYICWLFWLWQLFMVINRIASIRLDAKPMHMYKCVCVSIDIAGTKSGTPKSSPHNASLIAALCGRTAEHQRTISTK